MSAKELTVKSNGLPNSRLSVEIEIPAHRCKQSYEEALSKLSRSIKLPGFRQGKVPKAVIVQQVGSSRIQASALESLLQAIWEEALKQESIEPLCEPEVKDGFETLLENFNPAQGITVTLETDIAPVPSLKATKGLQAEAETISFDPSKVDSLIEDSRKQLATLIPIENRPAKEGDVAVISFKGVYGDDGTDITGGSSESMDIDLEEGRMIPGFVEGVIGMNLNEEKTLECQFPDDYPEEVARNRSANFQVKLKELKARELPALDDDFAKQTSDKSTMAELRSELEEKLKEESKRRNSKQRQEALVNVLVEQLQVDIPRTLIDQEVRYLVEQTAQQFAQQGMDVKSMFTPELIKSLMESSKKEAEENVRRELALSALAKAENIKVNQDNVEAKLKEIKKELSGEKNIDETKLKEAVIKDLLENQLLKWLEENNSIIEQTTKSTSDLPQKKPKTKSQKKPKGKS